MSRWRSTATGFFEPAQRQKVNAWLNNRATELVRALVTEYRPGTALGWHRDVPNFALAVWNFNWVDRAGCASNRSRVVPDLEPRLRPHIVRPSPLALATRQYRRSNTIATRSPFARSRKSDK